MKCVFLLALISLGAASSIQKPSPRIIGGTDTTINQYPSAAAILASTDLANYVHICGGTIINNRSFLTAAYCLLSYSTEQVRVRIGSTFANSGGQVLTAQALLIYPFENYVTEADLALFRSDYFTFTDVIAPSNIAGPGFIVPDNALLLSFGWGKTKNGEKSEQLQHVQLNAINHDLCKSRYPASMPVLDTHICSGVLDASDRSPCEGDGGGPLFYFNTIVGVVSYGLGCGDDYYPGVNTKVSSFTDWIVNNG